MIITDPYNMRHISGFAEERVHCTYLPPSWPWNYRFPLYGTGRKESDFTIVQEHRGHTREQIFLQNVWKRRRHTGNRIRRSVAACSQFRQDEKATSG